GATAHGKIRVYHQKGAALPAGWAFDADGRPTTAAAAALDGLIQPVGGHKGIGLAVVTGILSTLLSGAAYGTELGNMVDGPHAAGRRAGARSRTGPIEIAPFRRAAIAAEHVGEARRRVIVIAAHGVAMAVARVEIRRRATVGAVGSVDREAVESVANRRRMPR